MKTILRKSAALVLLLIILSSILFLFSPNGDRKVRRYSGYGDAVTFATSATETVNYTKREETYITTVNGVPTYSQLAQYPNSCGAVAGSIIVGFYDKYYNDLIPNYATTLSNGAYKKADRVYIPNLMGELYTLMRTNVDDVGVSEAECLSGLRTYVQNHGQTLTYTSILTSNQFNNSAYINAINNNVPSIVFCNKMDLCTIKMDSNSDTITKDTYVVDHVIVAYGYLEVKYYNGNTLFRTDKYLEVATGDGIVSGFLKLDSTGWCDAAYTVAVN